MVLVNDGHANGGHTTQHSTPSSRRRTNTGHTAQRNAQRSTKSTEQQSQERDARAQRWAARKNVVRTQRNTADDCNDSTTEPEEGEHTDANECSNRWSNASE